MGIYIEFFSAGLIRSRPIGSDSSGRQSFSWTSLRNSNFYFFRDFENFIAYLLVT